MANELVDPSDDIVLIHWMFDTTGDELFDPSDNEFFDPTDEECVDKTTGDVGITPGESYSRLRSQKAGQSHSGGNKVDNLHLKPSYREGSNSWGVEV